MSSTTSHYLMLPKSLKERYAYCVVKGYLDSKTMAIALRKTFSDVVEKAMLSAKGVDLNNLDAIRKETDSKTLSQIEDNRIKGGTDILSHESSKEGLNNKQNLNQQDTFTGGSLIVGINK